MTIRYTCEVLKLGHVGEVIPIGSQLLPYKEVINKYIHIVMNWGRPLVKIVETMFNKKNKGINFAKNVDIISRVLKLMKHVYM